MAIPTSRALIAEGDNRYLWALGARRAEAASRENGGRLFGVRSEFVLHTYSRKRWTNKTDLVDIEDLQGLREWAGQVSNLRPWD